MHFSPHKISASSGFNGMSNKYGISRLYLLFRKHKMHKKRNTMAHRRLCRGGKQYKSFIDCVLLQLLKLWDSHKGMRDTACCTDVLGSCLILHGSECPLKVILFFNPCTQTTTSEHWPLMKTSSIIMLTHCQSARR